MCEPEVSELSIMSVYLSSSDDSCWFSSIQWSVVFVENLSVTAVVRTFFSSHSHPETNWQLVRALVWCVSWLERSLKFRITNNHFIYIKNFFNIKKNINNNKNGRPRNPTKLHSSVCPCWTSFEEFNTCTDVFLSREQERSLSKTYSPFIITLSITMMANQNNQSHFLVRLGLFLANSELEDTV